MEKWQEKEFTIKNAEKILVKAGLTPKQKEVVRLRFGFNGPPYTFKEVGKKMGFSHQRARQAEQAAIRKIKKVIVAT